MNPADWETLPGRTASEERRLRTWLWIAASAYVAWSAACLVLHEYPVQATPCGQASSELRSFAAHALLLAGGPPLLLWSDARNAWPIYLFLSFVVLVPGGGAVMTWRQNVTLSFLLWGWTLVAWCSTLLVLWIAAF